MDYSKGLANGGHFLLVLGPLLSLSFTIPNLSDEVVESDHLNNYFKSIELINGWTSSSVLAQEHQCGYRG